MIDLRWVLAIIGFLVGRFRGAMIGFFLGALLNELLQKNRVRGHGTFNGQQGNPRQNQQFALDFELNLLKLSAIVITADGSTSQKELDYVRMEFVRMFGKARANQVFDIFKKEKNRNNSLQEVCIKIRQGMPAAVRSQLLHYLFKIALADGTISDKEVNVIAQIAQQLRIPEREFYAIKAMFMHQGQQRQSSSSSRMRTSSYSLKTAYTILEIDTTATDSEVKKAYRTLAKKYHPDKLQHLGKIHVEAAEEKFKKIQEAYEKIRIKRGEK